jgi:hypothetical protein
LAFDKVLFLDLVNVGKSLIPLERVDFSHNTWKETILYVVIHAQVAFYKTSEVSDNFLMTLVEESFQF